MWLVWLAVFIHWVQKRRPTKPITFIIHQLLVRQQTYRMLTQFVLAIEYLFAVPSDIMATFIRKHNSTDILWLLSSQISWPYFDVIPFCHSVTYMFWTLPFLQPSCFFGWDKTIMASLWLEIFLGLILISPPWVAQHSITCIFLDSPFFTAKLFFWRGYQFFFK